MNEFALAYFQRGKVLRRDIPAFTGGAPMFNHAILNVVNGNPIF